jgi:hypothetical protein
MRKRDQIEMGPGIAAGKNNPRKPYKKPELAVYGKLAELTAGVGGSNMDTGQSNRTKRGGG